MQAALPDVVSTLLTLKADPWALNRDSQDAFDVCAMCMYTPSHEATDMIHCLYELKESARRTLAWYGDPHAAAAGAFPEPPAYPPPETLNAPGIWVKFGSGPGRPALDPCVGREVGVDEKSNRGFTY